MMSKAAKASLSKTVKTPIVAESQGVYSDLEFAILSFLGDCPDDEAVSPTSSTCSRDGLDVE